jgi:hypothetical protein
MSMSPEMTTIRVAAFVYFRNFNEPFSFIALAQCHKSDKRKLSSLLWSVLTHPLHVWQNFQVTPSRPTFSGLRVTKAIFDFENLTEKAIMKKLSPMPCFVTSNAFIEYTAKKSIFLSLYIRWDEEQFPTLELLNGILRITEESTVN